MDYYLARLKSELAAQAGQFLGANQVIVEDADEKQGADLAIPVFAYAAEQHQAPADIAAGLASALKHDDLEQVEAKNGFVNLRLKAAVLARELPPSEDIKNYGRHQHLAGQQIVIEHTDANPFKDLHIGHIYSNTIGESLARLFEAGGAQVERVIYQGDVGLHIAKAVWAMGEAIDWQPDKLSELKDINSYYADGTKAYEDNEQAAGAIRDLNQKIYDRSDETVNAIYDWGKAKSFAEFDEVFKHYDTPLFSTRFLESQTGPRGLEIVRENMGKVFEDSGGAVVFRDDSEHTRVFVSQQGLPTYEAKDLGLAFTKRERFPQADRFLIITANEINAYFRVVLKALALINPDLAKRTVHLSHGLVKLPHGKMTSRSGDVVTAMALLKQVEQRVAQRSEAPKSSRQNALAAIKYAFLKQNIGGDIVYDVEESINLEGQTGPYVQYAAVRIKSILSQVDAAGSDADYDWQAEKRLLMLIAKYPQITRLAIEETAPHRVAQFVYELAREFNRYYETTSVKDAPETARAARVKLLNCLNWVIEHALGLLNISVPAKM